MQVMNPHKHKTEHMSGIQACRCGVGLHAKHMQCSCIRIHACRCAYPSGGSVNSGGGLGAILDTYSAVCR